MHAVILGLPSKIMLHLHVNKAACFGKGQLMPLLLLMLFSSAADCSCWLKRLLLLHYTCLGMKPGVGWFQHLKANQPGIRSSH